MHLQKATCNCPGVALSLILAVAGMLIRGRAAKSVHYNYRREEAAGRCLEGFGESARWSSWQKYYCNFFFDDTISFFNWHPVYPVE